VSKNSTSEQSYKKWFVESIVVAQRRLRGCSGDWQPQNGILNVETINKLERGLQKGKKEEKNDGQHVTQ
jgi:hypothetical protein